MSRRRVRLLHVLPLLVFAGLALLFLIRLYAGDPSKHPPIGLPVIETAEVLRRQTADAAESGAHRLLLLQVAAGTRRRATTAEVNIT